MTDLRTELTWNELENAVKNKELDKYLKGIKITIDLDENGKDIVVSIPNCKPETIFAQAGDTIDITHKFIISGS